jgi:hypothetical protein
MMNADFPVPNPLLGGVQGWVEFSVAFGLAGAYLPLEAAFLPLAFGNRSEKRLFCILHSAFIAGLLMASGSSYPAAASDGFLAFNRQWAVLIGVGEYPSDSGIGRLDSPRADVEKMSNILVQYGGFASDDITVLLDDKATYQNVNETFRKLRNQVQSDDFFVLYFSGRGSRVFNDVFPDNEPDTFDECFLLFDSVLENGDPIYKHLRDDEIGKHLSQLRAKRHLVIIDACYQGDNKEQKGLSVRLKRPDSLSVYDGVMPEDFLPSNAVVLEACGPEETTLDGSFTALIEQRVRSGDSDGIITMEDVREYARQKGYTPRFSFSESSVAQTSLAHPLLRVDSQPFGAGIYINGERYGTTPRRFILPIGSHKLEARKRGYRIWDNEESLIHVQKPGIQPIRISLTPVEITGKVKFRASNRPVEGATVTIVEAKNIAPTVTGPDGSFVFRDWSKDDLSTYDPYEVRIADAQRRIQTESVILKKPVDFHDDVSLGEIAVNRLISVIVTVREATQRRPMPKAVVELDHQQILDNDDDGVFSATNIKNPPDVINLEVSQDGYESHTQAIDISLLRHEYNVDVLLTPALNIYTLEASDQFKSPVGGVRVALNGEAAQGETDASGVVEIQRRLAPDQPISVSLYKDSVEVFNRPVEPKRIAFRQYSLPVSLDVTPVSLIAVDTSDAPVKGVRISIGDREKIVPVGQQSGGRISDGNPPPAPLSLLYATTDEAGKATIAFYRMPGAEINLRIAYRSQVYEETILQTLAHGRFSVQRAGIATAIDEAALKARLPIPPEINLSLTVQDNNNRLLPAMAVLVNGQAYGETDSMGKREISERMFFDENAPPRLEFQKNGETYRPEETPQFARTGTHQYAGFITLRIPYGYIEIAAQTEILVPSNAGGEGQAIPLNVNAEILLNDKLEIRRLPTTIRVFPGVHQLRILIGDAPQYSGQIKVYPSETVSKLLNLSVQEAWRVCMLALNEPPSDARLLESAEKIARALGRDDLVQIFSQRKERLR